MFKRQGWIITVSIATQIQCKHEYEYVLQYLWWETRVLMSYHFHRGKFVSVSVKFPRVYCFHCSNFRYPTAGTGTTFTPNLVLTIRPSCLTDSAWNEINRASSESSRKRKRSVFRLLTVWFIRLFIRTLDSYY